MSRLRVFFISGLLLSLAPVYGCSERAPVLEPLPEINLAQMGEQVQKQFNTVLAELEADATNAEYTGQLAMLLDAYRLNEEAAQVYLRARQLAPDNFNWAYLHGFMLAELDETEAAIAALRRALALEPDNRFARLALARQLARTGESEAAGALFEELVSSYPRFLHAHFEYGQYLVDQGQMEAAIESLSRSLSLSTRHGAAHNLMAQAYRALGRHEEAAVHFKLFERYMSIEPRTMDSLRNSVASLSTVERMLGEKALQLGARGRHRESADMLEQLAVEREGLADAASVHINLVIAYGRLGEYDKAEAHFETARALEPDSRNLYINMGTLRASQQRYEESVQFYQRAIELDPGYSVTHVNLGITRENLGQLEDAIASYRRALQLDPFDRAAKQRLTAALAKKNQPAGD